MRLLASVERAIIVAMIAACHLFSHELHSTATGELQSYYAFLKSHREEPPRHFIASLKKYIKDHPGFECGYLQLSEHLLYHSGIAATKSYFEGLAKISIHRRNSCWVVARIYSALDSSEKASGYYLTALRSGELSFFLLDDYLAFDHRNHDRFQALAVLRALGLPQWQFDLARAIHLWRKLDFSRASQTLQTLALDREWQQYVQNLLGFCSYRLLDNAGAEKAWLTAFQTAEMNEDLQYQVHILTNLGLLEMRMNNLEKSKSYHDRAIAIAESLQDLGRISFARANLGALFSEQLKFQESFEQHRQAFDIAIRIFNFWYAAAQARDMATASQQRGDFDSALASILKAEKYAGLAGNVLVLFSSHLFKGDLYNRMNLERLARFEYDKASQLAEATPFEQITQEAHSRLANIWMEQSEFVRLRKYFRRLMKDNASDNYKLYWQFKIGESYFKEGAYDSARQEFLKTYESAGQIDSPYAESIAANSRKRMADVEFELGHTESARETYQEEVIARVARRNDDLRFDQAYALGKVFDALGDRQQAVSYYQDAARLAEAQRENLEVEDFRIGYFSERSKVYHALARCYLEEYESTQDPATLTRLFRYLELSRARATKDALLQQPVTATDGPDYAEYQKTCVNLNKIQGTLREIQERLDSLVEIPDSHEDSLRDLQDSLNVQCAIARVNLIAKRLRIQKQPKARSSTVALSEVLATLKHQHMSLLLYHVSDEASFALAANTNRIEVVRLDIKPDSLRAAVDDLLRPFHAVSAATAPMTPFSAALAHRLYRSLVAPVEQRIELEKRLLIVPDLALMGLPFELLLIAAPALEKYTPQDAPEYAGFFLLHRYAISYSPSTWLLTEPISESQDEPRLLVFANPFRLDARTAQQSTLLTSRQGWRFNFLLFAEVEAEDIKREYANTQVYRQDDATETRLRREAVDYDILHFATHAFADTVFDAFSGLVLAADQDTVDDGLLMGYEIADRQFNCDLVSLSACETGRGQIVAGEGVLGLPRLFLGAGAQSVLMTLWQVDDKFASELMPKFYDCFLNKHMSKTGALAEAKRELLRQSYANEGVHYQHPFYWAAFTLYGDPGISMISPLKPFRTIVVAAILVIIMILLMLLRYYRYGQSH